MVKRLKLATRAFGSEPGTPNVAALAAWIAEHRGRIADIITYQLEESLAPQIPVGIQTLCTGGKFYDARILAALEGREDRKTTGEIHVDLQEIIEDAAGIVVQKKGAWCAMPAPHLLTITDNYYDGTDEWSDVICGAYRTIMRAMRDTGVAGNVLICDSIDDAELAALARQKVFFFQPEPDHESLAALLEHQRQVAVRKDHLEEVFDLTNEYSLQRLFIINPDPASIDLALSHFDPDQVSIGGYCTEACYEYWRDLADAAFYTR